MKIIRSLKAAAVVPLLLGSLAFGQKVKTECGTPLMPQPGDLSIHISKSQQEAGVYAFTAMCGTTPCDPSRYLFEWKFGEHDYSVRQSPERWFASGGQQNARLVLTGIKETDDPFGRNSGGCPPEVLRAGGCVSAITPDCKRPSVATSTTFVADVAARDRHEEFGKLLANVGARKPYRMIIASPDGNPVPNQRSQYPLVLENRSVCPTNVTTTIWSNLEKTRKDVRLEVKQGGKSVPLRRDGSRIQVTSTIPAGGTLVMLVEAHLPQSLDLDIVGEVLKLKAESEFEPVPGALECRSSHVVFDRKDNVLRAIDPSYLRLRTKHPITLGDRVRYEMIITNDGTSNPDAISVHHELDPIWERKTIKYKSFKIDGHRIKKEKYGTATETKPGEYYLHDHRYSDSSAVMVIKPALKHPLKKGSHLVIKFSVRLEKNAPPGWQGSDPGSLKLKRKERFVHHAFWTQFDKEGVWYQSESVPPTIVKPKSWKVWRFVKFSAVVIAASAAVIWKYQWW